MNLVLRLLILLLVPLLAWLAHGPQTERLFRRWFGAADGRDDASPSAQRTGHSSSFVWAGCYVVVFGLALGRAFLGSPPGLTAWLGLAVMGAGVVIRRSALRTLGEWFDEFIVTRPGQPVVDTGLFARCRHPLHKGLVLEILGMALINGHLYAFLAFGIAAVWFFVRGVEEERALVAGLGEPYLAYLGRVPSLIDRLPASWRSYRRESAEPRDAVDSPD